MSLTLPDLHVTSDDPLSLEVDALVVPVFRGAFEAPGTEAVLAALGVDGVPRDDTFRGKLGETLTLAAPGLAAGRVVLVGLGRLDELSTESLRRAGGAVGRLLAESATSAATTLPLVNPGPESLRAVAEGVALGAYRFLSHKSKADPVTLASVTLVIPTSLVDRADELVERAAVHARAQSVARDLVNLPSADKTPEQLCALAREVLPDEIEVEVWDVDRLREERCGGVLAVGQGSDRPPRMLIMRYRPPTSLASVALVGKGITFDSGGLSLKRPNVHMEWMKADMGGAAAVVGAMSALPALGPHVEVIGVCGIAENMPSGEAQRPSDVFTARNGTTVEVLNTDAEGRLVMADALSYAAEQGVDAIVDLATLTGASLVAVGRRAAAAMSNDDDVLRQILHAAEVAGEPTWHLPLWDDLREALDSDVADLCNINRRTSDSGGTIMAGLFLREFVDGTPWVHLDIAGPAFADEARHHLPKGGTGHGVRTLLRWLEETGGR